MRFSGHTIVLKGCRKYTVRDNVRLLVISYKLRLMVQQSPVLYIYVVVIYCNDMAKKHQYPGLLIIIWYWLLCEDERTTRKNHESQAWKNHWGSAVHLTMSLSKAVSLLVSITVAPSQTHRHLGSTFNLQWSAYTDSDSKWDMNWNLLTFVSLCISGLVLKVQIYPVYVVSSYPTS